MFFLQLYHSPSLVLTMEFFPALLSIFLLFLQPSLGVGNVTVTSSLTTDDNSWTSPSGDFAFGFRQLGSSGLFLLAVWFNKVPDRTIVWHANGDNPVPKGSRVDLTATGFVLTDPQGLTIREVKPATPISYAAMLDTGNFVLVGNDFTYIWESFNYPKDTILPSQRLSLGAVLFSRLTEANYSKGRFQLWFTNGSLQLNPIGWPSESRYAPYYDSGTYSADTSEAGFRLVFNESGSIYIATRSGEILQLRSWDPISPRPDLYYRATLDFDGVFTQYAHPKNSSAEQIWWPVQYVPDNICLSIFNAIGSGPCGYNSYCSIQNSRPRCDCPPGYVFADPNNRLGGCVPTYPQGCGQDDQSREPEELYEIREFNNVDWPLNDYERLEEYNQTQCEKSCMQDCSCTVAIVDGIRCWKKRLPLSNGRTWNNTFVRALFKVRKDVSPTGNSDIGRKKEKPILLGALLGGSVFINLSLLAVTCLFLMKRGKQKLEKDIRDSSMLESSLHFFAYKELEEATDGFREELGRGAFGIVYKGVMKSGSRNVIAVKKLDKLAQEKEREFRTEVSAIGKTHHKNLVRLLGYCDEGSNRLLIYDFMSNGTLSDFLFAFPRPDWHQRIQIALGIARGLLYLHEECEVQIIHCDIKPQNILLDDHFTAKISDFGLAKLLLSDQTRTKTMIRGTRGYVAPEWFKNVAVNAKVDVYSFGVLLLEIICCRRSVVMEFEEEQEERVILTDWAYDCYVEGRLDLLTDNDNAALDDRDRLHRWVTIAMWCIQEDPANRPSMKMVLEMLEGFVEVPLVPSVSFSKSSLAGNVSESQR